MISICMTCKNRSLVKVEENELRLFPNCIDSILGVAGEVDDELEIVVSDWASDDWPLETWLPERLGGKIPLSIVPIQEEGFSRGQGLNVAFSQSRGDKLFFLDTDMLFGSADVFNASMGALNENLVAFPICFSYSDSTHTKGFWRHQGYGNVMMRRNHFIQAGGWWERRSWGREDNDLRDKLGKLTGLWRENVVGFFHQWHPNDVEWKGRYQEGE
tara:strand:- start:221 stop:865 length:645 start_codon:yes stop_codon:yes gene_type:complete